MARSRNRLCESFFLLSRRKPFPLPPEGSCSTIPVSGERKDLSLATFITPRAIFLSERGRCFRCWSLTSLAVSVRQRNFRKKKILGGNRWVTNAAVDLVLVSVCHGPWIHDDMAVGVGRPPGVTYSHFCHGHHTACYLSQLIIPFVWYCFWHLSHCLRLEGCQPLIYRGEGDGITPGCRYLASVCYLASAPNKTANRECSEKNTKLLK